MELSSSNLNSVPVKHISLLKSNINHCVIHLNQDFQENLCEFSYCVSSLKNPISHWPWPCTRANCLTVEEMYSKYVLETVFKWGKVQKINIEPPLTNKVRKHKNLSVGSDCKVLFPSARCLIQGLIYAMQEFYHRGHCQAKLNT